MKLLQKLGQDAPGLDFSGVAMVKNHKPCFLRITLLVLLTVAKCDVVPGSDVKTRQLERLARSVA
jgi:hypothetical protein